MCGSIWRRPQCRFLLKSKRDRHFHDGWGRAIIRVGYEWDADVRGFFRNGEEIWPRH